jgi:hypothetical protein
LPVLPARLRNVPAGDKVLQSVGERRDARSVNSESAVRRQHGGTGDVRVAVDAKRVRSRDERVNPLRRS